MGFVSESRHTNRTQKLVAAVAVNELKTGYFEIVGNCGHRIHVIRKSEVSSWEERISLGRRHRKRCFYCQT